MRSALWNGRHRGNVDVSGPIRILICDVHRVLTDAMVSVIGRDGRFGSVAPPVPPPPSTRPGRSRTAGPDAEVILLPTLGPEVATG
jgi:hypothetical protein